MALPDFENASSLGPLLLERDHRASGGGTCVWRWRPGRSTQPRPPQTAPPVTYHAAVEDRHDRPAKPTGSLLKRLKLLLAANRLIHPLSQDWQTHLIRLLWGSPVRLEIVSLSPSR